MQIADWATACMSADDRPSASSTSGEGIALEDVVLRIV
jgi:hypothetical protein